VGSVGPVQTVTVTDQGSSTLEIAGVQHAVIWTLP